MYSGSVKPNEGFRPYGSSVENGTSPLLYYRLYKRLGINACGTVRPNRLGFPSQLVIKATGTNRGTYQYLSNGPLLACSWVDKRLYLLTTMHIGERIGNPTVKRRQADGSEADVSCPPCLPDYQKQMRGVCGGIVLLLTVADDNHTHSQVQTLSLLHWYSF